VTRGAGPYLALVLLCAVPGLAAAQTASTGWQALDVNRDGRFDASDIDEIMRRGGQGQPSIDVNRDGKKDLDDFWRLLALLTQWDRDASGFVDGADALPPGTLRLPPAPQRDGTLALADRSAREFAGLVPDLAALQTSMSTTWKAPLTDDDRDATAGYYENIGVRALLVGNLELAGWGFARAVQSQPERVTAVSNLGFVLSELERYDDALELLAWSLKLLPGACAVQANVATIFARHRQTPEALRHYRAAGAACPRTGQYRLNEGAALLRMDSTAAALVAFRAAERLTPLDVEATAMVWSLDPPRMPPLTSLAASWEKERQDMARELAELGEDPGANPYRPWAVTPYEERIHHALITAAEKANAEFDTAREQLRAAMQQRIEALAGPFVPTAPSCGHWRMWVEGVNEMTQAVIDTQVEAQRRVAALDEVRQRKSAANRLAMDPLILSMAMTEGQRRMPTQGRAGFEEPVRYYEMTMEGVRNDLVTARGAAAFNLIELDPDDIFSRATSPLYIMAGILMECEQELAGGGVTLPEPQFGLDIALAGFSLKPGTCEIRIRAGQGLLVAGTWSPIAGFGFEYGTGVDVRMGPVTMGAASYTRIGSDGSITDMTNVSAGVSAGALSSVYELGSATAAFAAQHAPVGASAFLARALGCD
jgi:tetratricopeptide (TPR) repeat protein